MSQPFLEIQVKDKKLFGMTGLEFEPNTYRTSKESYANRTMLTIDEIGRLQCVYYMTALVTIINSSLNLAMLFMVDINISIKLLNRRWLSQGDEAKSFPS